MGRRRLGSRGQDLLRIDSLMDILTCSVGVMLVMVILAVMEARGVVVEIRTPISIDPPEGSKQKIFLCKDDRVMFCNYETVDKQFTSHLAAFRLTSSLLGRPTKGSDYLERALAYISRMDIHDEYFRYEWGSSTLLGNPVGFYQKIKLREGVQGETIRSVEEPSMRFLQIIGGFDREQHWVLFLVDSDSIEVFRMAREICTARGLLVGWHPKEFEFPWIIDITDKDTSGPVPNPVGPQP